MKMNMNKIKRTNTRRRFVQAISKNLGSSSFTLQTGRGFTSRRLVGGR